MPPPVCPLSSSSFFQHPLLPRLRIRPIRRDDVHGGEATTGAAEAAGEQDVRGPGRARKMEAGGDDRLNSFLTARGVPKETLHVPKYNSNTRPSTATDSSPTSTSRIPTAPPSLTAARHRQLARNPCTPIPCCDSGINVSHQANFRGREREYGLGNEVTIHGDVYSYGILLLEMFTGKRPTNNQFGEALGLRDYVQMALKNRAANIIDQYLLPETEDCEGSTSNSNRTTRDMRTACISSILQIGISCSADMPTDRLQIGDALKELQTIRGRFHKELLSAGEPRN